VDYGVQEVFFLGGGAKNPINTSHCWIFLVIASGNFFPISYISLTSRLFKVLLNLLISLMFNLELLLS
jgi:hypothetical protein